jgi:hypothetical protein
MPFNNPESQVMLIKILLSLKDVLLGFIGGAVAYLFDYIKARKDGNVEFKFMFTSMLINMMLGAFVAYSVGTFIPVDTTGRDAIIGFSGVTAYNILLLAESKFATWIMDKLTGTKK